MTEYDNLAHIRTSSGSPGLGDLAYVKCHTNFGDGGGGFFLWRINAEFIALGDNDGTVIESYSDGSGRWVREYSGYVNVIYFGAFGTSSDYTLQIQRAIDFAAWNLQNTSFSRGATVFFPNGSYIVDKILLKSGVNLLGDSHGGTVLNATISGQDEGYTFGTGYLFEMDEGVIKIAISNFTILGRETKKGCFHFKARLNSTREHGGLWDSAFKNIKITSFKGDGIYLEGGDGQLPNQFLTFENVRVTRAFKTEDYSNSLKITGQQGQLTFLNCQFDGVKGKNNKNQDAYSYGHNVHIYTTFNDWISAVVSFINCTFQDADYGIYMESAENVTIDNCWFENLGVAVTIIGRSENSPSKSINILNSRFANAAGYGVLEIPKDNGNVVDGFCVHIKNAMVTVNNNYISPFREEGTSRFLTVEEGLNQGVRASGNTFANEADNTTYWIVQEIARNGHTIDCKNSTSVYVDNSGLGSVKIIKSCLSAGEMLYVKAFNGNLLFETGDNIRLNGDSSINLNQGSIAVFTKIDRPLNSYRSFYDLTAVMEP